MNTQHNRNGTVKYYRLTNADITALEKAAGFITAWGLINNRLTDIGGMVNELLALVDEKHRLTSEALEAWAAYHEGREAAEGRMDVVEKQLAGDTNNEPVAARRADSPGSVSPGSAPV